MAKVQGKKTAVAKRGASRPAARPKAATAGKKAAKKPVAPKVRAAAAKAKAKPAPKSAAKPVAKAKPAPKTALKAVKPLPKPAPKPAPKATPKAAPKPVPKPVLKAVAAPKAAPRPAEKPQPKPAPKPAPKPVAVAAPRPALRPAPRPAPAADDKKRARRTRPRITSSGGPVANWLHAGEKPRSSSFIPAPPRAEAPSLVAAPPASSDRLIRTEDLIAPAVRTVPVRVDLEAQGGRVSIYTNPIEVSLKPGEGIEWDFRYLGGADVTVDEIIIEFDKPSPFPQQQFRCKKPGIGRPQRQLSSAASQASSGRRLQYTIRAMTSYKTELGVAKPFVMIG
jgi:hypothetical protein